MATKFESLTKSIIFALLGILILSVAVPTIYITVASYLGNWSTADTCSLVTGMGCVAFPTDNTSVGNIPMGGLIATIVPIILGIAILLAIIGGVMVMVKWKGKGNR